MNIDWLDIINVGMIFQLLLFTVFLFGKKSKHISNYIFGVHLFSQAAGIYQTMVGTLQHNFFYVEHPHLAFLGYPFVFLWGPTFYFYAQSIAYKDFRFSRLDVIHLLPFLIIFFYLSSTFFFTDAQTKSIMLNSDSFFFFSKHIFIDIVLRIQILYYIIRAYSILFSVKKRLKENYSSISEMNISWLSFVIIGYSVCFAISVFFIYLEAYLKDFHKLLYLGNFFQFFIYFNIIFFKAWNQPEIFNRIKEEAKYKYSKLSGEEAEFWVNKLNQYLSESKIYRDPELSLNKLAECINVQPRILSQIINEHFNKNFFDLINSLRIQEAKKYLLDPECKKNILEILYETGFNSKSTFNRVFKRETGFTPTVFKRKCSSSLN